MLSDEWLPRYRLLENFNIKWNGNGNANAHGNGNAYDRGDYNSSFALRAVELKMEEIWGWNQNDKNGKFSIFLHKIICCGCVLESPPRGDSNTHPKHMILWRIYDN